jgi:hypothetical protein
VGQTIGFRRLSGNLGTDYLNPPAHWPEFAGQHAVQIRKFDIRLGPFYALWAQNRR